MKEGRQFSSVRKIQGRAAPENEGGLTLIDDEYNQGPADWGEFVFPLCDGHGAVWTRKLFIDANGSPLIIDVGPINADAIAATENAENARSFNYGFNGATWDRIRSGGINADNIAAAALGAIASQGFNFGFDGATWDRGRTQSVANAGLASKPGIALATGPAQWAEFSTPAANTQAIATRAAGAAGVAHVAKHISAEFSVSTAGVPVRTLLQLLDGAAVLWQIGISTPAAPVGTRISISETVEIAGSPATAMSLQFDVAGGAATFESVALTGYDIS